MFKRLFISFCLIALFLPTSSVFAGTTPFPTPTPTKEEYDFASMTTYEMFWPITAGKVPGDKFYTLKIWRDKLMGALIFSSLKKSEYYKNLANKRLVEAERLIEINRDSFLSSILNQSKLYLQQGLDLLLKSEESWSFAWLKGEYKKDIQKHLIVLTRMEEKVEGEPKAAVEKSLEEIKALGEKYQLEIIQ